MKCRTRIKFCGITRAEDAAVAVALGVDALGFVFHAPSPRNIEPAAAREIITGLPAFVSAVGLFVDTPLARVREIVDQTGLTLVQFHGEETAEYCAAYGAAYLKAVRVRDQHAVEQAAGRYPGAAGLLLDTYHPVLAGGTGQQFDWRLVPRTCERPLILAGGLDSTNVARAIRELRPYAVDVSGGIEQAKGVKDPAKMRAFVAEVNRVECEQ